MKNYLLLPLLILCGLTSYAQTDKRLKGVEKELNQILEETKAAGFAVAVVEGDKIIYSKGFGYSDYENKVSADGNTLFAIGSSTKAFTSSILGQLRNEDKLSFDDSPIQYIPELKFYNKDMNNNIIIKDLMCHRTGLPRHDFSWYLFPANSKDSLLQRVEFHEPFTSVRNQWYYNNFMFLAQGVIAERVTGKSWEDNIIERFFKPLGMTRSNVSITELEKSTNAAFGYGLKDDIITKRDYYKIAGMAPAGSINSSVNEMSNWLITWINKGKFKGQEILSETYVNEAMSSQMVIGAALPDKEFPDMHLSNYGYGWFISSYRGHYRVEHGGNIDGFSASVAFFPSDSIGIVVLANQNGSAVPYLVRNTIADRLLGGEKTNWGEEYKKNKEEREKAIAEVKANGGTSSNKVKNTKLSHSKQEYAGLYSHPGYGDFTITLKNDSLFANLQLTQFYLQHFHYDVFTPLEVTKTGIDTADAGGLLFNFNTGDYGDISFVSLKLEAALDPIKFKHTPASINVNVEALDQYVGEYEFSGVTIKFYVKGENILYAFVPGQPEYELFASDKHKFSFKTLEGFKVEFLEGDNKNIGHVLMVQPNGTFKATRK